MPLRGGCVISRLASCGTAAPSFAQAEGKKPPHAHASNCSCFDRFWCRCYLASRSAASGGAGLRVFAGQPLKHEKQPSRMIRAALVVATARAAAPLDAATTKRLDQLQDLLHQAHTTPLPTWTVSHEDADAIDWAPLANGSAKVVEAGAWRGISGRAQARGVYGSDQNAGAHAQKASARCLKWRSISPRRWPSSTSWSTSAGSCGKSTGHTCDAGRLVHAPSRASRRWRGGRRDDSHERAVRCSHRRAKASRARGAWYTPKNDAGRARHCQKKARRPAMLARALLECFRSFSEEGGYFLDDLTWRQFSRCGRNRANRRS